MSDDLQVKDGVVGACPASPVTALSSADADQAASRLAPHGLQSTGAVTLAICGTPKCDHDWHGPGSFLRLFDDNDGGERVCGKCGVGAMTATLMEDW